MRNALLIIAILAALLSFSCDDGAFSPFGSMGGDDDDNPPNDKLKGVVHLQNMDEHSFVNVELVDIATSLLTDNQGSFTIKEIGKKDLQRKKLSKGYFDIGNQHFHQKNYHAAVYNFLASFALDPQSAQAANNAGVCWYRLGLYDDSIMMLGRAFELSEMPFRLFI